VTDRDLQDRLVRRARRLGLSLTPDLTAQLVTYLKILSAWNRKINLTGLDLAEPTPEAVDRLVMEPLIAAKHVSPDTVHLMDVGSGGGSPAVPLVLALPRLRLHMVESKTRKAVFLREVVRSLALEHVEVVTARFEELLTKPEHHERHDLLTIRAVRIEARVLKTLQTFIKPGGRLFLFRGPGGADLAETVTPPLAWEATYPLVENLRSRLVVLGKRPVGHSAQAYVPRGTQS
jgi:16S rRNA (guanine527-N7)-methyltransferase